MMSASSSLRCVSSMLLLLVVAIFALTVSAAKEIQWDQLENKNEIELPEDFKLRFIWGDIAEAVKQSTISPLVIDLTASPDETLAVEVNDTVVADTTTVASEAAEEVDQKPAARRQRREETQDSTDTAEQQNSTTTSKLYNVLSGDDESRNRFRSGQPAPYGNISVSLAHLINTTLTSVRFYCEGHSDFELIVNFPTNLKRDPSYGQAKTSHTPNKFLGHDSIKIYVSVGGVALLGLLIGGLLAYSKKRNQASISKNSSISSTSASKKHKQGDSNDAQSLEKSFALESVKSGRKPMLSKKKKSAVSVIDDIKQAWQKKENNSKSEPYRLLEILRSFREQQHAAMKEEEERRSKSEEVKKQIQPTPTPDLTPTPDELPSKVPTPPPQQQQQQESSSSAKPRRGSRLDKVSKTTGAALGDEQVSTTDSTDSSSGQRWQNMSVPDIQRTVQRWKRESVDVDKSIELNNAAKQDPSSELKESEEMHPEFACTQTSEGDKAAWEAVQQAWQEATSSAESDSNSDDNSKPMPEVFDFDEDVVTSQPKSSSKSSKSKSKGPVADIQSRHRKDQSRLDSWNLSTGDVDSSSSGVDSSDNSNNAQHHLSPKKAKVPQKTSKSPRRSSGSTRNRASQQTSQMTSASRLQSWSLSGGGDDTIVEATTPVHAKRFSEDSAAPLPFTLARAKLDNEPVSYNATALSFKKNDLIQVFNKQKKGLWDGAVIRNGKPTTRGLFPFTVVDVVPQAEYTHEMKELQQRYTPTVTTPSRTSIAAVPIRVNPLFNNANTPKKATDRVVDDGADE